MKTGILSVVVLAENDALLEDGRILAEIPGCTIELSEALVTDLFTHVAGKLSGELLKQQVDQAMGTMGKAILFTITQYLQEQRLAAKEPEAGQELAGETKPIEQPEPPAMAAPAEATPRICPEHGISYIASCGICGAEASAAHSQASAGATQEAPPPLEPPASSQEEPADPGASGGQIEPIPPISPQEPADQPSNNEGSPSS